MKILCDINSKDIDKYINSGADGFILYLKDYSVNGNCYFDVDEICEILTKYDKDFFVSINKNMFNSDLDDLLNIMINGLIEIDLLCQQDMAQRFYMLHFICQDLIYQLMI